MTFARIADAALMEIGRYGRSSVSVTCRLLDAIRSVASCVRRSEDRAALALIAQAIGPAAETHCEDDRLRIARCRRSVDEALRTIRTTPEAP